MIINSKRTIKPIVRMTVVVRLNGLDNLFAILFLLFSSIQIFAQTMTPAQAKVSRENFISDAKLAVLFNSARNFS